MRRAGAGCVGKGGFGLHRRLPTRCVLLAAKIPAPRFGRHPGRNADGSCGPPGWLRCSGGLYVAANPRGPAVVKHGFLVDLDA